MAQTRTADVLNHIQKIWSKRLFVQAVHKTFWHRWQGPEDSGMPIVVKTELEKEPGDEIKFDIRLALSGTGATGDTALLEGNEEALKFRQTKVTVESLQHAVRWSKKSKILITHAMRREALAGLRVWLAEQLDTAIFNEITGGTGASLSEANLPTSMKYFAGDATSVGTVADTDASGRLKLNDISNIRALAKASTKIEPIRLENGEEIYGLVLHDYAALALKKDAQYQQANREARERGRTNPLFTGALAEWDGVVMFASPRVRTANDGASSITVARNVLFGANMLSKAWAYYPDWTEQEFSYGQEIGVATFCIHGQKLNVFDLNATETTGDSTDDTAIGAMLLYSAAVAPTA